MGRIIDGDRVYPILKSRRGMDRPSLRGLRVTTRIEGRKIDMECYSKTKVLATSADLALVQEHYGVNMSEALQISLHKNANAIREDRAKVKL